MLKVKSKYHRSLASSLDVVNICGIVAPKLRETFLKDSGYIV